MPSIIRQNGNPPALPDFRNLGTVLRILVAVNAGAALYAFARQASPSGLVEEWTNATTVVEPYLFVVLALLYAGSPRLARLPFRTGAALIALVTVLAGIAWFAVYRTILPQVPGTLLVWLIWALLATGALLLYFQLRSRALSPAITEARLQALQARIRPHFLFNSINAVLSLVRSEPARAEEALHDMAELFRVLMRDNRELAPLADEVELCRHYLELEQLRLGERLQVDWNVKSMPGDALVPPLVLQPLLENAVYHGIEPSSQPGTVSINLFLSRGEVHAILRNPYRAEGGRHHSGNKMALANVRERLALHFDAEASLESRVTKDGYEVHIRMPYRTTSPPARAQGQVPRNGAAARGANGKHAGARKSLWGRRPPQADRPRDAGFAKPSEAAHG
jgi:two-component system, LytTR family, sensor histidine kinase AlgZ